MNIKNLRPPVWIDTPSTFNAMLADLKHCTLLAVDTESNSLYAYQEQVCLIQFSTPDTDFLLDPLTLTDISPLGEVFANPDIEKIFHAAEYDIICLRRDFGFTFSNLFDTMVASRILGRDNLGLGTILKDEFDIDVNKKYQRANWGKRPLNTEMLQYARLDTHFLIDIRNKLKDTLLQNDRWALAQEDFERLCHTEVPIADDPQDRCWKVLGKERLENQQLAALQALCEFREVRAKAADLPVFKILNNKTLLEIAKAMPQELDSLQFIPGMSHKLIQRYGSQLLKTIKQSMRQKPYHRPANNRHVDPDYLARVDALRNWRKLKGIKIGVPSDVILPKEMVYAIASATPDSLHELESVLSDFPWRFQQFGPQILSVLESTQPSRKNSIHHPKGTKP